MEKHNKTWRQIGRPALYTDGCQLKVAYNLMDHPVQAQQRGAGDRQAGIGGRLGDQDDRRPPREDARGTMPRLRRTLRSCTVSGGNASGTLGKHFSKPSEQVAAPDCMISLFMI